MKEVNATWKRVTEVFSFLIGYDEKISKNIDELIKDRIKMKNYIDELSDIIEIRKDAALQATNVDCTVVDMECNADQMEGLLDDVYSELNNLKENIRQITKGGV